MRSYSSLAAHTERRTGRAVERSAFLSELDVTDTRTAVGVHQVARRSYAVEAELIGFDGIPALTETLEEMQARPLRWLGMVTRDGRIAAFVAWQRLAGEDGIDIDRVCVDPQWFRRGLALKLLDHLLAELAPGGKALVSTGADNRPAICLYERLGFTRVGTVQRAPGLLLAEFRLTREPAAHPIGSRIHAGAGEARQGAERCWAGIRP
ncbi:GNAT family N-acetyltransferase [Streptomyces sp. NPDC048404]|uniref:GNAT family N-acetyltransferase n=1 Tax=unclassified Streptomyces TaxID=2593676 RepID=UPI0034394D10